MNSNPLHNSSAPSDHTGTGAPLLLDGKAVCELLSIGLSTLYCMHRSGELGPMGLKLRGRRLWRRQEIEAWVAHDCPRREKWSAIKERNSHKY